MFLSHFQGEIQQFSPWLQVDLVVIFLQELNIFLSTDYICLILLCGFITMRPLLFMKKVFELMKCSRYPRLYQYILKI